MANNLPQLSVSVKQAAEATSLSDYQIREAIYRGHLKAKKSGPRIAIKVADLAEWLDSLPDAAQDDE